MLSKYDFIRLVKHLVYWNGEEYTFSNKRLKFIPNTRPVHRKYRDSLSDVVRNDVLQIDYFEKLLNSESILWDIGAHHGHYSIFAAAVVKGSNRVFSFEPDAYALKKLRKNIEINNLSDKIRVSDLVISESDTSVLFSELKGNSNSHIVLNSKLHITSERKSRSIDSLLSEYPTPTIVKIDTEGAEISILRGATNLLSNHDVTFVCELHPFAWPSFNVTFEEFESIISASGRKLRLLDGKRSSNELPYYGTVIF
jgi:FkbM family methyltransferase